MRHRLHTFKIGRTSAHRKAMLANMVSSLIEHGEIKTTITKAKEARRVADKMIVPTIIETQIVNAASQSPLAAAQGTERFIAGRETL